MTTTRKQIGPATEWMYAVRSGLGGLGASGITLAACSAFVIGAGVFTTPGGSTTLAPESTHRVRTPTRGSAARRIAGKQLSARAGRTRTATHARRARPRITADPTRAASLPDAPAGSNANETTANSHESAVPKQSTSATVGSQSSEAAPPAPPPATVSVPSAPTLAVPAVPAAPLSAVTVPSLPPAPQLPLPPTGSGSVLP